VFYNVTENVKALATVMIVIYAAMMPFSSFAHNCYFTLRSGGQTFITFLFDSAYVWAVSVPTGLLLSRLTDLPIIPLFIICNCMELGKCIIGLFMLKSGKWAKKLV
jgi:Na+-driven multidrug efflux pump